MLELLLGGDPFRAGLLKKMGQLQTQPAEMLFFVFFVEELPTWKSQLFYPNMAHWPTFTGGCSQLQTTLIPSYCYIEGIWWGNS